MRARARGRNVMRRRYRARGANDGSRGGHKRSNGGGDGATKTLQDGSNGAEFGRARSTEARVRSA